jgi:sugar lactone lactonase YvrE
MTKIWIAALAAAACTDATAESKGVMRMTQVVKDVGFMTPESVLYDAASDLYLVSNINGSPTDTDDNGFISRLSPDGKVKELKWIDGAKPDVKLDAPKGMAISGGVLWVADITVVRKFDAKTGKPLGEVKVDGATFLNDVAPGKNGGIYVTDSGLTPKFESSGTDAVYSIAKDGKVTTLAKSKALGNPNGVVESGGKVYVVTFGTGSIYEVPAKGDPKPEKLPKGKLDGIVAIGNGELLVSSWEAKSVYRGKVGGPWADISLDIESPADIGWDSKRKKLLVPSFTGNSITIITSDWK